MQPWLSIQRARWLSCLHDFAIYLIFLQFVRFCLVCAHLLFSLSRSRSCSFVVRFALLCFMLLLYCSAAMDLKLCQANQNYNLNFSILFDLKQLVFDLNWRYSLSLCCCCCCWSLPFAVLVVATWDIFLDAKLFFSVFFGGNFVNEMNWSNFNMYFDRDRPFFTYFRHFCMSPQSPLLAIRSH